MDTGRLLQLRQDLAEKLPHMRSLDFQMARIAEGLHERGERMGETLLHTIDHILQKNIPAGSIQHDHAIRMQ